MTNVEVVPELASICRPVLTGDLGTFLRVSLGINFTIVLAFALTTALVFPVSFPGRHISYVSARF